MRYDLASLVLSEHDTITDPMSLSDGSYCLLEQLKVDLERDPSINCQLFRYIFLL